MRLTEFLSEAEKRVEEGLAGDLKRKMTGKLSRADHAISYSLSKFNDIERQLRMFIDEIAEDKDDKELLEKIRSHAMDGIRLMRKLEKE